MKKINFGILSISMAILGLSSCKKEDIVRPSSNDATNNAAVDSKFNISSDGRMLIFLTTEDYEKVVNDPTDDVKSQFRDELAKLNHTTYLESLTLNRSEASTNLVVDDDLAEILNEDWIVQIGDYLYRVNKPTESVYVLPAEKIDEYQDLVAENRANENILKFSTDDDVIELVENGSQGERGLFCSEGGVGSRSNTVTQGSSPGSSTGVTSTLRHSKFGIYFTIVVESSSDWSLSQFKFAFPTNANERRFKRRCESMEYVPYFSNNQWESLMSVSNAKYKIKESAKNFSQYHVRAKCNYYHNDLFMSQSVLVSSAWMEIRINL